MINFEKYRNEDGSIHLVEAYEGEVNVYYPKAQTFLATTMTLYPIKSRQVAALALAMAMGMTDD